MHGKIKNQINKALNKSPDNRYSSKPSSMIKILHTSDLHIGKRLYQAELYEEQSLFFRWMTNFIRENKVNVLLISGDLFDVANPSSESRRVYYQLLRDLMMLKCKVLITAGNHDSPSVLQAPAELLKHLDIHVTGALPDDIKQMLVPLKNENGQTEAVVACVPFLRDADLRRYNENESYQERTEAVRQGIASVYQQTSESCQENYPSIPAIAMGHLYVQGGTLSESERDIQIGNQAGIREDSLPSFFQYYALGHLHKPQQPHPSMVYSGSPVQLSFSEYANQNHVMLLTVENQQIRTKSIAVPLNRRLTKMEGTVAQLRAKLNAYTPGKSKLNDFIELVATEEDHDPSKLLELETLIEGFKQDNARILKYRIHFVNAPLGTASLYEETKNIAEMKPEDVFRKRLDKEGLEDHTQSLLMDAFREILQEVEEKTSEEGID